MKATISLLMLFIVIKQITSENEGNAIVSNKTIESTDEITSSSLFKNIAALYKKIANIGKKNDSTIKENSTTDASTDLLIHNVTQEPFNNSKEVINLTTIIAKHEADFNTTASEDVLTVNETDEGKKLLILEENSTIDDSLTHNATQEHFMNITTDENLPTITATLKEAGPYTTAKDDVPNTNSVDESEIYSLRENDSISADNVETIVTDLHTDVGTEINSDIVTTLKSSLLDPQQHENYCKSYIDNLLKATFTEYADQLEPLILEDKKIVIENNLLLFSTKGEMGLYDGKITGMSKGKTVGECIGQTWGNQIRLMSTISFDEADLSYKGRATFMDFGPKITVNGKLSGSLVELHVIVPKDGGTGEVKRIRVRNIGRLEVDVKGLGPINWAVGLISEEVVNVFRLSFRRSIEKELKNALEDVVTKITYP